MSVNITTNHAAVAAKKRDQLRANVDELVFKKHFERYTNSEIVTWLANQLRIKVDAAEVSRFFAELKDTVLKQIIADSYLRRLKEIHIQSLADIHLSQSQCNQLRDLAFSKKDHRSFALHVKAGKDLRSEFNEIVNSMFSQDVSTIDHQAKEQLNDALEKFQAISQSAQPMGPEETEALTEGDKLLRQDERESEVELLSELEGF